MKKLFIICLLMPAIAHAQQPEVGINYGFGLNATASVRFMQHLKVGLGYTYAEVRATSIFGDSWKNQLNIPFVYAEYYNRVRKHEFYYGIDVGKMYVKQFYDTRDDISRQGYVIGLHAGYSRKLISGLYGNVQAGILYCHISNITSSGVFIPLSVGVHYIFGK